MVMDLKNDGLPGITGGLLNPSKSMQQPSRRMITFVYAGGEKIEQDSKKTGLVSDPSREKCLSREKDYTIQTP